VSSLSGASLLQKNKREPPKPTATDSATPSRDAAVDGKKIFLNQCARCHRNGEGGAVAMIGMVPNLTDSAWQAKMNDAQIANTIMNGKGKMPAFGKLLREREVKALVQYIRSFKK